MTADWQRFVERYTDERRDELDLTLVRPGDTWRVITGHTDYLFEMIDQQEAELRCSRSDRPTGRVRIAAEPQESARLPVRCLDRSVARDPDDGTRKRVQQHLACVG